MKKKVTSIVLCLCATMLLISPLSSSTAAASSQANPGGGMKGFLYEASRNEILSKAKSEGALRASLSLDPASLKIIQKVFKEKYPFIDGYFEEITGRDSTERLLLELQTGRVPDWDILHMSSESYTPFRPYLEKIDLWAMAGNKILNIPPPMISPKDRNALGVASIADIAAYNSKLLKAEEIPTTWEGFLKPELKGRKFILDIRPNYLTGLVPGMGMEWVLDYARKLAAQDPIWVRGQTRALTSMAAGEYKLALGTYYHSLMRARNKGMTNLEPIFLEPVSIRLAEVLGVLKGAKHPYAGLLLLEFLASPEGQQIIDDADPGKASVFVKGSLLEQVVGKRKLSVLDWDHFDKFGRYSEEISKAYGFPTAREKKK